MCACCADCLLCGVRTTGCCARCLAQRVFWCCLQWLLVLIIAALVIYLIIAQALEAPAQAAAWAYQRQGEVASYVGSRWGGG